MTVQQVTKRPERFEAIQLEASGETVGNGPEIVSWINEGGDESFAIYYDALEAVVDDDGNLTQEGRPEYVRIVVPNGNLVLYPGQYVVRGEDSGVAVYDASGFADKFQG